MGETELTGQIAHLQEIFSEVEADLDPAIYKALQPCLEGLGAGIGTMQAKLHNYDIIQRIHKLLERFPTLKLSPIYVEMWERLPDDFEVPQGADIHVITDNPPEPVAAPRRRGAQGGINYTNPVNEIRLTQNAFEAFQAAARNRITEEDAI